MSIPSNKKTKSSFRGFGKRMRANLESKPANALAPAEAIKALRTFKAPKFDQTVNVVVNLGIDPKSADQALRGSIAMPHGIGRSARVVCFCQSDKVAAAKAAGAVEAGMEKVGDDHVVAVAARGDETPGVGPVEHDSGVLTDRGIDRVELVELVEHGGDQRSEEHTSELQSRI